MRIDVPVRIACDHSAIVLLPERGVTVGKWAVAVTVNPTSRVPVVLPSDGGGHHVGVQVDIPPPAASPGSPRRSRDIAKSALMIWNSAVSRLQDAAPLHSPTPA